MRRMGAEQGGAAPGRRAEGVSEIPTAVDWLLWKSRGLAPGWRWLDPYRIAEPDAYLISAESLNFQHGRVTRIVPFGCGYSGLEDAVMEIMKTCATRTVIE